MPRTKRRYKEIEVKDSSESEADETDQYNTTSQTVYPRAAYGGGKQLRPSGGKQIRLAQHSDEDDSDEESEEERETPMQPVYSGRPGGGKQLRPPMGGGKQMRYSRDDDSDEDDNDEDDDDQSDPEPEPVRVFHGRGGGGKMLRPRPDSDSESEDDPEPEPQPVVMRNPMRGGKMLRPQSPSEDEDESEEEDENSDVESDKNDGDYKNSDDEVEEENQPTRSTARSRQEEEPDESAAEDMELSSDEDEEDEEVEEEEEDEESSDEELDIDKLDQNQLIENDDDQKYLDSLPEIERESILAQRFEKLKANEDMKKALRENKKKEREKRRQAGGTKKSGAKKTSKTATKKAPEAPPVEEESDDDDDDSGLDTSGDHKMAKEMSLGREAKNRHVNGLKAKKQRALAKLRKDRSVSTTNKKDEKESDSDLDFGDDDDDESDDDEYTESKPWMVKQTRLSVLRQEESADENSDDDDYHKERNSRNFVEADLLDYKKVTLPRRRLERWCNEPFFERAVLGYFVLVSVGLDTKTMKKCYRLCKITDVYTKDKQYSFPMREGSTKAVVTNKALVLQFATSRKRFNMAPISDKSPTEDDVKQYVSALRNQRGGAHDVLSKKKANKMRKEQDDLVNNYTYSLEDVQKSIATKKALNNRVSNLGAENTKTNIAVKAAKSHLLELEQEKKELEMKELEGVGNPKEISEDLDLNSRRIEEARDALKVAQEEEEKIKQVMESRKTRLKKNKATSLAMVNARAQNANKVADYKAYQTEQEKVNKQESGKKDLYARRRVKPRLLWEVGQDTEEKEPEKDKEREATTTDTSTSNETKSAQEKQVKKTNLRSKKYLADQMNDITIEEVSLTFDLTGAYTKKIPTNRVRKGMSLQVYLERKAAGAF